MLGKILIFSVFLIFYNVCANAQGTMSIVTKDFSKYPAMSASVFVFDANGNPVYNLNKNNFVVRDNGLNVPTTNSYVCSAIPDTTFLSVNILFDLALNHNENPDNPFNLGKQLATKIVNRLKFPGDECAISTYDIRSYLNREIDTSRSNLLNEIDLLQPSRGSLFDIAFLSEPANGIKIINRGTNKKVIFFITDGAGAINDTEIINLSKANDIQVYTLCIGRKIPEKLKNVSIETGGWYLDNIEADKIDVSINVMMALAQNHKPCVLQWDNFVSCDDEHTAEIVLPSLNLRDSFNFSFQNAQKASIVSEPQFIGFSSVEVGNKKRLSLTITARNRDILIQELQIDEPFSIVEGNVTNYLLAQNDFLNLTIEYEPQHEAIVFTEIKVISDACDIVPIYITGGFPNTKPIEKTVKIVHPNGGEYLIIGDTSFVEWIGLLPKDVIQLQYSIDNGRKWDTLATNVTGLRKDWVIPNKPSDSCLVKILQLWPNNVGFTLDLKHNGRVNSGFFNREGDLVVTASSDTTAVVWVANTGAKKFILRGHTRPLTWATFDPNDKYVATSSTDSMVMIWSLEDGSLVKVLEDHATRVESVNWSSTGDYLVSSDYLGNVIVWNTNWEIEKKVQSNKGVTWFADFNPIDENLIITANQGGKVKVFNWVNYTLGDMPLVVYDTKSIECTHVTYNTDATKVAAATSSGEPKVLYVWDVNTTDPPLYSITHNIEPGDNNSINFSSFFMHPDLGREVLLTTSTDQTARLWDASDGSPERINDFITDNVFKEHKNSVTTAVFDRFGSRVMTSSWDSTAKIWNLDQKELQQDVSDSVFTIAFAEGKGFEHEFGEVVVDELIDSVFQYVFVNESKFAYNIRNISIGGNHAADFEINSDLEFPILLQSGDTLSLELRFMPKGLGMRSGNLEFQIPGRIIETTLTGFGIERTLKANNRLVDFKLIDVGSIKDSTFIALVTNTSSSPLNITNVGLVGSYRFDFGAIGDKVVTIPAGSDLMMTLRFSPKLIGRKNAQVYFEHDGLGSPTIVNLFGEGVFARNDSITIYIGDHTAEDGDVIQVPIKITGIGEFGIAPSIEGFRTQVKFNATMLEPLDGFTKSTIINGENFIDVDLPTTFGADSVLKTLTFKVGLGNDSITTLTTEFTYPIGFGRVNIFDKAGSFTLTGYCIEGGPRLFDPNGRISLSQNEPNPAVEKTNITIEVVETGVTKLYISDIFGRVVRNVIESSLSPGEHQFSVFTGDLSSGVYFYILETPTQTIMKKMEIKN
ncbi:MAG: hypothetical protein CVV22_02095 [Ignavibacteriae bacterium HGW-Ignavibacteriae-1]|nr:MAG: hypothetical protein CVV22_02095 [Ignavibacteriae bacterium HGW-Ignavibacteriae-1]